MTIQVKILGVKEQIIPDNYGTEISFFTPMHCAGADVLMLGIYMGQVQHCTDLN